MSADFAHGPLILADPGVPALGIRPGWRHRAVAGQLLVEAVARRRGLDPDAPPGLNKVTLTR